MKAFFSVSEIADLAGCSVSSVHRAANAGRLNGMKIGKRRGPYSGGRQRLFLKMDVENFLNARRAKARRSRRRGKAGSRACS